MVSRGVVLCLCLLSLISLALGAARSRGNQNSARSKDKDDWSSCRCSNASHCVQLMTDQAYTKQTSLVATFPKNYKRAMMQAKQRDAELEATLSRMLVRFSAVFSHSYTQQVEQVQAVLKRLERLKERQEYDNPHKFMGMARGVSKALTRTHASFNDFVAQIVSEYQLINKNVLQLL